MGKVEIRFDAREIEALGNLFGAVGKAGPRIARLAVGEAGRPARTRMVGAIKALLHTRSRMVNAKVIGRSRGIPGGGTYVISSSGVLAMKYLDTVQTRRGVVTPTPSRVLLGRDQLAKAFQAKRGSSGVPGSGAKRRATLGGHIVARKGAGRTPLTRVQGASLALAMQEAPVIGVFRERAARLPHILRRMLLAQLSGAMRGPRRGG